MGATFLAASRLVLGCLVCSATVGGSACSEPKPEPEIASAASLPSYAQAFPAEVDGVMASFGDAEVESRQTSARFAEYPQAYDGDAVDYAEVAEILEQAAAAGRARAYYEQQGDVAAVRAFYREEKEELRRKVAGAAQHAAKEAGCEADVGGAAAVTLDRQMDERTTARLRAGNDAHRLLERRRAAFGKKNAAVLEQQIDETARASFLVYIELVEAKVRLRRLVEEAPRVEATAAELIEAEQSYQSEHGRTDAEKKAAGDRIASMKEAQGRLETAVRAAERMLEGIEPRIERARQGFEQAQARLRQELRRRPKPR